MASNVFEDLTRFPNPDGKFGWNRAHDVRSRAFRSPLQVEDPQPTDWEIELPILDQQEGSCVLQTLTQLCAFTEHWRTLTPDQQRAILLDPQAFIREWYRKASRRDPFPDAWEPDDTGTDGNTGAKVARDDGFAKGHVWAFGFEEAMTLLNHGPVGYGGPWMTSFDRPDVHGVIRWDEGAWERGGHEFAWVGNDPARELIKCRQTWGLGFGVQGIFYLPYVVAMRLLPQGDLLQLVPNDQPVPLPSVDPEDLVLAKNVGPWAKSRLFSRITQAGRASQAIKDWARTKGIPL